MKTPKVNKQQQIEGLEFVTKQIHPFVFRNSVRHLIKVGFLSRAEGERIQKIARHHYGISFEEWMK